MPTGSTGVDPADYELPSEPPYEVPSWLTPFVRDEVWSFLDSHRDAARRALARWLASLSETDERLRQLGAIDVEARRLACLDRTDESQRNLAALIQDKIARISGAYNSPPVDLPLPPPGNRVLQLDDCLVALMALNDETRDPLQRIGPTNSSLYGVLCSRVRELTEAQLPGLRSMLRTAKAAAEAPPTPVATLVFEPGAIIYRGHREPLSGKPWQVLKALADAPGLTLSMRDLLKNVWGNSVIGEETVRRNVYTARQALRKAMQSADVTAPDDPIPAVDRGTDRTAWHLDML